MWSHCLLNASSVLFLSFSMWHLNGTHDRCYNCSMGAWDYSIELCFIFSTWFRVCRIYLSMLNFIFSSPSIINSIPQIFVFLHCGVFLSYNFYSKFCKILCICGYFKFSKIISKDFSIISIVFFLRAALKYLSAILTSYLTLFLLLINSSHSSLILNIKVIFIVIFVFWLLHYGTLWKP